MGSKSPNRIWACIFWSKAIVAILLSIGTLGYLGYEVYRMHEVALVNFNQQAKSIQITPERCTYNGGLSRLEPPNSQTMLGFHLHWEFESERPVAARDRLGRIPAIINAFLVLDEQTTPIIRTGDLIWHGQQTALIGGIFQLTVEPTDVVNISDNSLELVADYCRQINEMGVPMFLRFGHEMNGDWVGYAYKAVEYTRAFQRMATILRRYTNSTGIGYINLAMVWAPNLGTEYPFSVVPESKQRALADPTNMLVLDTNKDGDITQLDDPYEPFYPGDEYVDWVGLSLYWYPTEGEFNQNIPTDYFEQQLVGASDPARLNFYQRFAVERNKPMMIAETSAPYIPGASKVLPEEVVKGQWIRQLFNQKIKENYPLLKAIIIFEESKKDQYELERDWRMMNNPKVRDILVAQLDAEADHVLLANEINTSFCDGTLPLK